jgi:transcriptional regulator with XRE-family HTH domain
MKASEKPIDLYKIIKTWRWRISYLDITEQEFSRIVGVSRAAVSFYLNNDRIPSLKNFHKIENYLRSKGA